MSIPHASPDPLTSIVHEARRAPASSRLALRDVAKTYVLQETDGPLAQGDIASSAPGGRAEGRKKRHSTTLKFYWNPGIFSSVGTGAVDK